MSYRYVKDDGDWFAFPLSRGIRHQCCACGLIHDVEFRRKGRGYEMRFTSHKRATSAARRCRKKAVVIVET